MTTTISWYIVCVGSTTALTTKVKIFDNSRDEDKCKYRCTLAYPMESYAMARHNTTHTARINFALTKISPKHTPLINFHRFNVLAVMFSRLFPFIAINQESNDFIFISSRNGCCLAVTQRSQRTHTNTYAVLPSNKRRFWFFKVKEKKHTTHSNSISFHSFDSSVGLSPGRSICLFCLFSFDSRIPNFKSNEFCWSLRIEHTVYLVLAYIKNSIFTQFEKTTTGFDRHRKSLFAQKISSTFPSGAQTTSDKYQRKCGRENECTHTHTHSSTETARTCSLSRWDDRRWNSEKKCIAESVVCVLFFGRTASLAQISAATLLVFHAMRAIKHFSLA